MLNQAGRFPGARNRLVKRLQRQCLGTHRIRQSPSNHAAGEHIRDEPGVHKVFSGSYVGNISHPQPIRLLRLEVAIYQARTQMRPLGLRGRYRRSAFGFTGYTSQSHQTCSVFTTNINLLTTKCMPHLSYAIDTVIFSVDLADVFN